MDECVHGMDATWCATCSKADDTVNVRAATSSFQGGELKQDVLNDITDMLGLRRYVLPPGGGSSLPSEVFEAAAGRVDLPARSMPEICEAIVLKAGHTYSTSFDSRGSISGGGSTVTLQGMQAMRKALGVLL